MDGWNSWTAWPPEKGRLIELARIVGEKSSILIDLGITYPEDINPASNVVGLYWRLTGIGKEYCKEVRR